MAKFKGIVLYNIETDGCLNGVYTNNHPSVSGTILTETARFIKSYPDLEDGLGSQIFEYDCFYFDFPNGGVQCQLVLRTNGSVYKAKWLLNGVTIFEGEGFKMNNNQIAISYWPV